MTRSTPVGVIGAGAMGAAMARRLLGRGFAPVVNDPRADIVDSLVNEGMTAASSPAAVAELADVVLLVLPDPEAVISVMRGTGGLGRRRWGNLIVADLTTSAPEVSRTVAEQLGDVGAHYLDVGVLGNPPTALSGTMTFLVGGDTEVIDRCQSVLGALTRRWLRIGPVGAGHTAKLVANELFLSQVATMGEALSTVEAAGLEPDAFLDAIDGLGGRGSALADIGRTMRSAPPESGFALRLAAKDARLLREYAEGIQHGAPLMEVLSGLYAEAARLDPDGDFTRVYDIQRERVPEGAG